MSKEEKYLLDQLIRLRFNDDHRKILFHVLHLDKAKPTQIASRMKMTTPLISYYLNGNKLNRGLVHMRFVERINNRAGLFSHLRITKLGEKLLELLNEDFCTECFVSDFSADICNNCGNVKEDK